VRKGVGEGESYNYTCMVQYYSNCILKFKQWLLYWLVIIINFTVN
jgi:hypothetical protein